MFEFIKQFICGGSVKVYTSTPLYQYRFCEHAEISASSQYRKPSPISNHLCTKVDTGGFVNTCTQLNKDFKNKCPHYEYTADDIPIKQSTIYKTKFPDNPGFTPTTMEPVTDWDNVHATIQQCKSIILSAGGKHES